MRGLVGSLLGGQTGLPKGDSPAEQRARWSIAGRAVAVLGGVLAVAIAVAIAVLLGLVVVLGVVRLFGSL